MATVFIASRKMKLTCPAGDGGVEVDDYRSEMIGEFMACHAACFNKALLPASPSTEEREGMEEWLKDECDDCLLGPMESGQCKDSGPGCLEIVQRLRALLLAPPVKVTREWVEETTREVIHLGNRLVDEEIPYFQRRLRERGIEVGEKL